MEEQRRIRKTGIVILVVLCALLIAVGLRWSGYKRGNGVRGQLGKEWTKLELVLNQIQHNYVDSVDVSAFIEETLPAIMDALDPHSIYLPPEELRSADEELRGNIEGIGIVFNVPNDTAKNGVAGGG